MTANIPRTISSKRLTSTEERLHRIQVLVVISSPKAAQLVDNLFKQLGFQHVYVANDGAEAIQILREIEIHLMVTDSDLKVSHTTHSDFGETREEVGLSGLQFVERLRHAPNSPNPFIPVLMLMDIAHAGAINRARDAGVNDVILKPLQATNFCERIIQLIDQPRPFITAPTFRGPCRRRHSGPPPGQAERRIRDVRVIRCDEMRGRCT